MRLRHAGAGLTALAIAAMIAAPAQAEVAPADGKTLAYYSSTPQAPQSKSAASMRRYLSTPQTGFDLQSYPLYGSLVDTAGRTISFTTMMQQTNHVSPVVPGLSYALEGVMWNRGKGFTAGGVQGVPEYTLPLTMTQRPWSIRAQAMSLGAAPQFVDMRVVDGRVGEKGAVYEITANVNAAGIPGGTPAPATVYVRATDRLGIAQWGYGPSGFMPQWVYPHQRDAIVNDHGGSIEKYLKATDDTMAGQGAYYYTTPLLRVDAFTITRSGDAPIRGSGGWLLMDAVTQSFGTKGEDVVKNDVSWLEFSTQLPGTGQALKIGRVYQESVGALPYAMLASADTGTLENGSVATRKWNMNDIRIAPVPGHLWTSPRTGNKYHLKYRVHLAGRSGQPDSVLTYSAKFNDQEVAFPGGRAVYEGLYTVTGTLDGTKVTGQAWAEVQPAGSLG